MPHATRIGTVLPADLPIVAQAAPGAVLRPRRVSFEEAQAAHRSEALQLRDIAGDCAPLIRDPATIRDLPGQTASDLPGPPATSRDLPGPPRTSRDLPGLLGPPGAPHWAQA